MEKRNDGMENIQHGENQLNEEATEINILYFGLRKGRKQGKKTEAELQEFFSRKKVNDIAIRAGFNGRDIWQESRRREYQRR